MRKTAGVSSNASEQQTKYLRLTYFLLFKCLTLDTNLSFPLKWNESTLNRLNLTLQTEKLLNLDNCGAISLSYLDFPGLFLHLVLKSLLRYPKQLTVWRLCQVGQQTGLWGRPNASLWNGFWGNFLNCLWVSTFQESVSRSWSPDTEGFWSTERSEEQRLQEGV